MNIFSRIRDFMTPPVFTEDDHKTQLAFYIGFIVKASVPALLVFVVVRMRRIGIRLRAARLRPRR